MYPEIPNKRWTHIIPVAAVMYILAYVDRINVAMALPYMKGFALTSADMGLAAGIFFVGYMVMQIPAGILAGKFGAKRIVTALMILWGVSAVATGLVESKTQLYVARFVLGLFEGGVWPAVLVLLATWFPSNERARANALWMICLPASAVLMAPITGLLIGSMSWRWVFILEGIPPLLWAGVWWHFIADSPKDAKWLSTEERSWIDTRMMSENVASRTPTGYWEAFTDRRILLLALAYFFWMAGFYGYTLWMPNVVKNLTNGGSSFRVGLLSAIPFLFAIISMLVNSVWSDRRMQRRAHVVIPLFIGAIGLIGGQICGRSALLQMAFLVIAAIGIYGPFGPFWAIPSSLARAEVVGASIGIINAIGNLGGFLGPYAVGYIRERAHGNVARCLVPVFDGAYFSRGWKEALWDRFYTGAPRRQRRFVERYSIVKRA